MLELFKKEAKAKAPSE